MTVGPIGSTPTCSASNCSAFQQRVQAACPSVAPPVVGSGVGFCCAVPPEKEATMAEATLVERAYTTILEHRDDQSGRSAETGIRAHGRTGRHWLSREQGRSLTCIGTFSW